MLQTKKIMMGGIFFVIAMLGCVRGAKVTLQAEYPDPRFQPSDRLHAGCTNSADISFAPQGQNITKFTLVMYYNPDAIEMLRIIPKVTDGSATSTVEYNRVIFEVKNPKFSSSTDSKVFFQVHFKSNSVGKHTLAIGTGSEAITPDKTYPLKTTFTLDFAQVPECDPDIIAPSISLIYPKDSTQRIHMDQYFVFDIKDAGKGIDKNSLIISFGGEEYVYDSENFKRNGSYLNFYPKTWIPVNKAMDLVISIADKQSYGGANTIESTYSFKTATGMSFLQGISPMMFRSLSKQAETLSATTDECILLGDLANTTSSISQTKISSLMQKFGCDVTTLDAKNLLSEGDIVSDVSPYQKNKNITISVLASIGWLLFFISLILKFHYFLSYKKHKKLAQKLQGQK